MKKGFSEQEVLELLDHLKSAENGYPSEMILSRREVFIKQAAAVTALTGPSGENGNGSAGGSAPGLESLTLNKVVEIALVLALAAGAGISAYIYRETIMDFVNSTLFPKTELTTVPSHESTSEPAVAPVMDEDDATETQEAVPTLTSSPTATVTVTPISTPVPSLAPDDDGQNADSAEETNADDIIAEEIVEGQSTPVPTGDSGLHLGQTPKPERTLPPNNNGPPNEDRIPGNNRSP